MLLTRLALRLQVRLVMIHPLLPIDEGEGEKGLGFFKVQLMNPWNSSRLCCSWTETIVLAEENVPANDTNQWRL